MQFTLTYDGPLPSRGSADAKSRLRSHFEPQLRELWGHRPLDTIPGLLSPEVKPGDFSILVERHGHTFAPLVSEKFGVVAELDILMLRAMSPGALVHGGDIDNRLKTLLDALSAPAQSTQVTDAMRPTSTEDPLFVLLDDDRLVTRMNVDTDRLLDPPQKDAVRLTIRVTLKVIDPMMVNISI